MRNPARTKASILDSAYAEFCAHGPAGARVDRIADAAGVNKRMIYHYFGSKDDLFVAVVDQYLMGDLDGDRVRLAGWEGLSFGAIGASGANDRRPVWSGRTDAVRQGQARELLPKDLDGEMLALALLAIDAFPRAFAQYTKLITGETPSTPGFDSRKAEFDDQLARVLKRAARREPKPRIRLKLT